MKKLWILVVVLCATYLGYVAYHDGALDQYLPKKSDGDSGELVQAQSIPTPEVPSAIVAVADSLLPGPPTEVRRTPEGVFYVKKYFSVTTADGIFGVRPGSKVETVEDRGSTLLVRSGADEFEIPKSHLTDELDVAAAAARADAAQQTLMVRQPEQAISSTSSLPRGVIPTDLHLQRDRNVLSRQISEIDGRISQTQQSIHQNRAAIGSLVSNYRHSGSGRIRMRFSSSYGDKVPDTPAVKRHELLIEQGRNNLSKLEQERSRLQEQLNQL